MHATSDLDETVFAGPAARCPDLATLLAEAAEPSHLGLADHLDACAPCRRRVLAARQRATELPARAADPGCDLAEALLAELDDGAELSVDDQARLLVHFVSCEGCRGPAELPEGEGPPPLRPEAGLLPIVARATYQLESELARGGMGRIVRAFDRRLGRTVAIKEALPPAERSFADVHHWHARLEREARITARLNHPSIVSVHEAGIWPRGTPFFAMNLVAGRPLDRVIAEAADLDGRLALLPHVVAVADALAYAHTEGIVHRDLKPSNVLVGRFGETVVIDWGLAKDLCDTSGHDEPEAGPYRTGGALTQHGATIGTPAYMAPEQAAGKPAERSADVYALGALLYHLLTGQPPYRGDGVEAILAAVRAGTARPATALEPRIPAALATIVATAMALDPAARYPSAAELADELRRFQTGQLVTAHDYGLLDLARHWLAHRRVSVALAAGLVIALIATGGVGLHGVLSERDRAGAAATRAERFNERLVVARARAQIAHDPTAALAWLRRVPLGPAWLDAREVAAEAEAEGVARHVLASHATAPHQLATSPSGRLAASGAASGELRVWDLVGGRVRHLGEHGGRVYELALAPDERTLAVAGARGLELWDLETGTRRPLAGHHGPVYTVGFASAGAELVSGGEDGTVRRWDLASGTGRIVFGQADPGAATRPPIINVRPVAPDATHVLSFHASARDVTLVLSARGRILAVGPDGATRWATDHPAGMPNHAALAPDGDELATLGQDGELRRWRVDGGTWERLAGDADVVNVAYAPGGRWLAAATSGTAVRLWDLRGGPPRLLSGHSLRTDTVAFSRDGRLLASAGFDGDVRVWDPEQGELWTLRGHRTAVPLLAFGAEDTLLSLSFDGTARLWQPGARPTRALEGHDDLVRRVRFAGPRLVTAGAADAVRVWDPSGRAAGDLPHPRGVADLWVAPRGDRAVTTDWQDVCRLWDVGAASAAVVGEPGACTRAASFEPSGAHVATLDRRETLRVWSARDPSAPVLSEPDVLAAAWSATGELTYVTRAGLVVRRPAGRPAGPPETLDRVDSAQTATWSGDARTVALRRPRDLVVIELATGRRTRAARPAAPFQDMHLSADGRVLAIGDLRGRVHVVDTASGRSRVLTGHARAIDALALSDDGRHLASASQGELLFWDLEVDRYRRLHGHARWVETIAFSPDGSQLASAGADGTVRLWCAELTRPLPDSPSELERALAAATTAVLDADDQIALTPATPWGYSDLRSISTGVR